MADDTNFTPAVDTASAEAPLKTKEKKTRAPRKPKAAAETVADTSVSAPVKKTRGPAKKAAAITAPVAAEPAAKASGPAKKGTVAKAQPAKRAPKQVEAAPVYTDGFADLLKLEEENQKLRKTLSDKLRAENADLRKKLGTA
jgi:putative transposase